MRYVTPALTYAVVACLTACATHTYYLPSEAGHRKANISCGSPDPLYVYADANLTISTKVVPKKDVTHLLVQVITPPLPTIVFDEYKTIYFQVDSDGKARMAGNLKRQTVMSIDVARSNSIFAVDLPISPPNHLSVKIPSFHVNGAEIDMPEIEFDLQTKKSQYTCVQ
jgi:hypothetical protein